MSSILSLLLPSVFETLPFIDNFKSQANQLLSGELESLEIIMKPENSKNSSYSQLNYKAHILTGNVYMHSKIYPVVNTLLIK